MISRGRTLAGLAACLLAAVFAVFAPVVLASAAQAGSTAVAWADEQETGGDPGASGQSDDGQTAGTDNLINPQQLPDKIGRAHV